MPRISEFLDQVMHQPVDAVAQPVGDGALVPPPGVHPDGALGEESDPVEVQLALQYAELSLDHHGLEGLPRDNVRRFAKLNELQRQIELYTSIETLKVRCTTSTAATDFVRSQPFLTHCVNRLKVVLISPHTMHYVRGLQEWILNHMHDHPTAWKIPQEIINSNDQWEIFAALVRVRLTSIRSQSKDRLFKAHAQGLDINQIIFKLAPKQAVISDAHRARWSWIALSIEDFKEACSEGGEYESGDFWTYLEDQLATTKAAISSNPLFDTQELRTAKLADVFVRALEEHRRLFPTRVTRGRVGERPAWQESLEEAMGMGREIYATSVYA